VAHARNSLVSNDVINIIIGVVNGRKVVIPPDSTMTMSLFHKQKRVGSALVKRMIPCVFGCGSDDVDDETVSTVSSTLSHRSCDTTNSGNSTFSDLSIYSDSESHRRMESTKLGLVRLKSNYRETIKRFVPEDVKLTMLAKTNSDPSSIQDWLRRHVPDHNHPT